MSKPEARILWDSSHRYQSICKGTFTHFPNVKCCDAHLRKISSDSKTGEKKFSLLDSRRWQTSRLVLTTFAGKHDLHQLMVTNALFDAT